MMVSILDPKEGETVYDPACGTGGMLIEVVHHVHEAGGDQRSLYGRLYGQEKNLTTSAIARMNLILHGVEDVSVARGDTLREPAFYDGDLIATFDCVIANPPFSLKKWGEDVWAVDRFGRNLSGTPPRAYADWAWVQHMMASMAVKSGRLAVVLPTGAMTRSHAEARIRRACVERDLIEAVIGLGPNLFYGTQFPTCILVVRDRKPERRRGRVLFIDATTLFKRGRNQNTLEPQHANQILAWYLTFKDVAGYAHVATQVSPKRTPQPGRGSSLAFVASNTASASSGRIVALREELGGMQIVESEEAVDFGDHAAAHVPKLGVAGSPVVRSQEGSAPSGGRRRAARTPLRI